MKAPCLTDLRHGLSLWFEWQGVDANIDESILTLQQAIHLAPENDLCFSITWNAFWNWFEYMGEIDDADKVIMTLQ